MTSPQAYDYLIVGGGLAAASAVGGIRSIDSTGTIAIVGGESDPPVYRPDLSKRMWLEEDARLEDSALLEDDAQVTLHLGHRVASIDPGEHRVTLEDGSDLGYRMLLLATGAEPVTAGLEPGPRVVYLRSAEDHRRLRELVGPGSQVAVVGGGYIGSEMASALVQNDVRVTLVMPQELVGEAMFPPALARYVTDALTDHGVRIVRGQLAGGAEDEDGVRLRLEDGTELTADAAVIGVGVRPSTELAEAAGMAIDDGIAVDDLLRTSARHVFAAGDAVCYPDALLGRRRVEHADNAERMGEAAGRNMAGAGAVYDVTPFFFSDLFDDGYEAIGEVDTRHRTVEDWQGDEVGTGVVYYLDTQGHVRGVLLWNVWDQVQAARDLIARTSEQPVARADSLRGTIAFGEE